MKRTWGQNSDTINGLWPHCQWTDEEIDLWHADLSGLDQDVLFEAIREVKRSKESLYPQLAWVHAAYRTLVASKRAAERTTAAMQPAYTGEKLEIDMVESRRLTDEITRKIEGAGPDDVDAILAKIDANVSRLDALAAARLSWKASAKRAAKQQIGQHAPASIASDQDAGFEDRRRHALQALRAMS